MSMYIYSFTELLAKDEVCRDNKWQWISCNIFGCWGISFYGFLANVRNVSCSPFISSPRGFPEDVCEGIMREFFDYCYCDCFHSQSWVLLSELLDFDYDQVFENRRGYKQILCGDLGVAINGAAIVIKGEGEFISLKDFLPEAYFEALEELKIHGDPNKTRVIFWFD